MNSTYIKWLPILLVATLLIACEETELPTPQSSAPTVTILSPLSTDSIATSGDRIILQVQFDDDEELHEMAVFIIRMHDGTMVYQADIHQHGNSYRWIDDTTFTTAVESDFEIRAIVTDHELQRTEATETFRLKP